jgi:hypothetical protein
MYTVILYRSEKEIKRSKPMAAIPERFIEHSYYLYKADSHKIERDEDESN